MTDFRYEQSWTQAVRRFSSSSTVGWNWWYHSMRRESSRTHIPSDCRRRYQGDYSPNYPVS